MQGLSPVATSGGHSSSPCAGLSLSRPLLLQGTGSRRVGSVAVAHGPSCSAACGIFPDQGSNPCPLHWQADSQPLRHQGSPNKFLYSWTLQNISVVSNYYKYNVYFINIKIILSISQFFCVILGSLAKTEDTLLRRCTALWFISNLKDQ